jgi:hypothetical protein
LAEHLGIQPDPRRRAVDEADVIEELLVLGWPGEVVGGRRAQAVSEAREALERLVRQGLPFQDGPGGRRFDGAEVEHFAVRLSLDRGDPFWRDQVVSTGRRQIAKLHGLSGAAERCPRPSSLPPRRFALRMRRRFNLGDRTPGASVRLRMPAPIEDAALRDLRLELLPIRDSRAVLEISQARIDAKLEVPAGGEVELGYEARFTALASAERATNADLSAAARELYTRRSEGLVKATAEIRELARDLTSGAGDDWSRVVRMWDYLLGRLRIGQINYDEIDRERPGEWTLQNGWTDCQLASALQVSLCRAVDIPARLVSGVVLEDETPDHHYWAEIWIDGAGWRPFDTLSWVLAAGGRDPWWNHYYAGEIDYRMKTECLPRLFNGAASVRLPQSWRRTARLAEGGLEVRYSESRSNVMIYVDSFALIQDAETG